MAADYADMESRKTFIVMEMFFLPVKTPSSSINADMMHLGIQIVNRSEKGITGSTAIDFLVDRAFIDPNEQQNTNGHTEPCLLSDPMLAHVPAQFL